MLHFNVISILMHDCLYHSKAVCPNVPGNIVNESIVYTEYDV